MKIDEVKLRLKNFIHNTIDLYVSPTNFFDKMKNSTAKLWVDQNIWKLNKAIEAFGDEHGEIDEDNKEKGDGPLPNKDIGRKGRRG